MNNVSERNIIDSMISTGALVPNPKNGEIYVVLSRGALAYNPAKQAAFDFLSQFDGRTYAGLNVTKKKHKVYNSDEVADAITLTDPTFKPEWMRVLGF